MDKSISCSVAPMQGGLLPVYRIACETHLPQQTLSPGQMARGKPSASFSAALNVRFPLCSISQSLEDPRKEFEQASCTSACTVGRPDRNLG